MTPEAMRIAVAKAVGTLDRWLLVKQGFYYRPNACGYTTEESSAGIWTEAEANKHTLSSGEVTKERAPLIDYPGSLDAMALAEAMLEAKGLTGEYVSQLRLIARRECGVLGAATWGMIHASALQRCEAFCLTLGLDEEAQP